MSSYLPSLKWPSMPTLLTRSSTAAVEDAPLCELPPHELEALEAFKQEAIPLLRSPPKPLPEGDPWGRLLEAEHEQVRDEMLLRLLRFNGLSVDKSVRQLKSVLAWRTKSGIAGLDEEAFHGMEVGIPVARLGCVTDEGEGLFFAPAECYDKKRVERKRQEVGVAKMFEHMLYGADGPGIKKGTVVVDFSGFSIRNVDLGGLRTGVMVYMNYYPDVFHKTLLINYPTFMYAVWRAIAPLLDARTASRVIWVSDGDALREELAGSFPRAALPSWMGGDAKGGRFSLLNGVEVDPKDLRGRF